MFLTYCAESNIHPKSHTIGFYILFLAVVQINTIFPDDIPTVPGSWPGSTNVGGPAPSPRAPPAPSGVQRSVLPPAAATGDAATAAVAWLPATQQSQLMDDQPALGSSASAATTSAFVAVRASGRGRASLGGSPAAVAREYSAVQARNSRAAWSRSADSADSDSADWDTASIESFELPPLLS